MHIIEPIAWQMGMEFLDGNLTFQDTTQLESWKFPASGQVPRNNDPNTVPFHSIRQSRITGPSKIPKCHGSHGNLCWVPNSFGDHVTNL